MIAVLEALRHRRPLPLFARPDRRDGVAHAESPTPALRRGITKNNLYTLYDMAMLGITSHSKVPLRLATMAGFSLSLISLLIAVAYLVLKLAYWDSFGLGMAPVLIGMFFLAAVQLFFQHMRG